MQLDLYTQTLLWGFGLAVIFGAISKKSNFCTLGAISDWINIGDTGRMRAWGMAMVTAMLGVGILEYLGDIDMSLITSNDTSNPPYRGATLVWLRHLVGGAMFGIGMTLASGCGNKTLVRLGEGNMKSVIVLIIMAIAVWWMLFSNFGYLVFLQWMLPLSINFAEQGIPSQDIAAVIFGLAGVETSAIHGFVVALLVAIPLLVWIMRDRDFRANRELLFAGVAIGLLVVIAWYITAGPTGIALLEELDFRDQRPFFTGAQSFTFIGPAGHVAQYIIQGFSSIYLTFGVVIFVGVAIGSFLFTVIFQKIRIEWFASWQDFFRHAVGAILMGIGGVLGLGCTIGQGVTGLSTLAIGSFLTLFAIIGASAATMKFEFYLMMREDD